MRSIQHAFRAGFKLDATYLLTKIDRWFLHNIKEIVDMEEELVKAGKLEALV
jgi:carbamoyl-phosphate synthase large subunit